MSSLNFLYETPLFPLLGALLLIWAPWLWGIKSGNKTYDQDLLKGWLWVNIVISAVLLLVVLNH